MSASRYAVVALLFASACTIRPVNNDDDDGGGGQGGSEGGGDSGGGGSAAECSTVNDCEQCWACASNGPCEAEIAACQDNHTCVAIDECLVLCGGTPAECWETCRAQNPTGIDDYDRARGCLDCTYCEHACATPLVCGS